jgi:hypothetical protein
MLPLVDDALVLDLIGRLPGEVSITVGARWQTLRAAVRAGDDRSTSAALTAALETIRPLRLQPALAPDDALAFEVLLIVLADVRASLAASTR